MTVHVVSRRAVMEYFSRVRRESAYAFVKTSPAKLDAVVQSAPEDVYYLDASAFPNDEVLAVVERLSSAGAVGVIDPDDVISDPARVFFAGGIDYIGSKVLAGGVPAGRIAVATRITRGGAELPTGESETDARQSIEVLRSLDPITPKRQKISGSEWRGVTPGREYTFWLLFAELDGGGTYTARRSDADASRVASQFLRHLATETERFGGRAWMWKGFSGLLLFPFDGERCTPIIPLFRLMMNRVIATSELYQLESAVSYHFALHLGNTTYVESGRTGGVVSEDVNFVFHLGTQYTGRGEATITEIALSYVPEGLYRYFVPKGAFEGNSVYRMRRPGAD